MDVPTVNRGNKTVDASKADVEVIRTRMLLMVNVKRQVKSRLLILIFSLSPMSLPDYLLSAHALVKALKAARDPPQDGGPTKLSIATTAIHEENTYLPNKEQIVLDFILDTWSRSKPG